MMHKELAAFPRLHEAVVRPIACIKREDNPVLVYPYWNGRSIEKWYQRERGTRGALSFDKKVRIPVDPDTLARYKDPRGRRTLKSIQIFREHRLEIACTL